MADPVISELIKQVAAAGGGGGTGIILTYFLMKKFFSGKEAGNGNGNVQIENLENKLDLALKEIRDSQNNFVRGDLCAERERRIGDDIGRLKRESQMHFEAQEKTNESLHQLDKKTDIIINKLDVLGNRPIP